MNFTTLLSSILITVLTTSCIWFNRNQNSQASVDNNEKSAWIEKVATTRCDGRGISFDDDMNKLMTMSRSDIVDHFIADSYFGGKITEVTLA